VLLTGGRIYTLDRANRVADTLLIRDGRIRFAGRRADINPPAGEPVRDLGGRAVLPGLTDAHAHLMHLAWARLAVDVAGTTSEAEAAARVGAATARLAPGEWIGGRGWDQNRWRGGDFPTAASLDRAAPRHPVALARVDGHALWSNSAALALPPTGGSSSAGAFRSATTPRSAAPRPARGRNTASAGRRRLATAA
jgi:predicted amidohydrolase YtcJ